MNKRITKLRNRLFEQEPKICSERCKIFTKSIKQNALKPIAIRRANAFYDVLDQMTVWVKDDELIVGNQAKWPKSSPIFPEYSSKWILEEIDGTPYKWDERPGDKFYADEDVKEDLKECIKYWEDKALIDALRESLPDDILSAWDAGIIDETWVSSQGLGNEIVDYNLVINKGLKDVIERIENRMSELDMKEPDNAKKMFFLQGALKGNQAVINFANRIADTCKNEAEKCSDKKRKAELLKLSDICNNVPYNPARSFHEAVQAIYIILLAVHLESNGHAISLGRFDQYVYPFYKKDLENGVITKEEALEIIECFYIKCNELNKLRSWGDSEFFLGYQMFINLAVAGQDKDGNDMTNDISYLCIEACEELKLVTPSVSVKWFPKTPNEFMMRALEATTKHQGGMPAFYNDLAFMRTLKNMGIADDDLCEWSPDGCIEASIPGKWDFAAKGPWLSVEKVLDITLNNGVDTNTGRLYKATTKKIEDCTSIDEIYFEYTEMLKYFMDLQVETEHVSDYVHCLMDINAFRSSLVDDCIGRCLDLVEGGAIYSADGGPTAGTISSGDALAALDYAVFTEKILTLDQVLHACKTNYEDMSTTPTGPEIRAIMKNKAPKFGNDDERADKWTVNLENFIGSRYRNEYKSSKYGKGPIPCCFSYSQSPVSGNIAFGRQVGATPEGRKKGEPVNNGISPSNGSEKNGATAACNSVGKLPSIWFQKGAIFNMRLAQNAFSTEEQRQRVIAMIKVLFGKYAQQIQFNVVNNEIYKDAIKHPEKYQDLMVRVSGYSALFTSLAYDCQMDVINRTEIDI